MRTKLTIILLVLANLAFGQSFSTLKNSKGDNPMDKRGVRLFARYTSVSSKHNGSYGSPTINISFKNDNHGQWEKRIRYENPTLGDLIRGVPAAIRDIKAIRDDDATTITTNKWENHAHGGGIVGWFQYYLNVVARDQFILSPGVSFGDYIYTSKQNTGVMAGKINDPAGYFLDVGPAIMASYLVSEKLWIDGYVNYDISVYRVSGPSADYTETPGYQKPHFLTVGADLNTNTRWFGGVRMNRLIDKGTFKDRSSRLDISIGINL